MPIKVVDLREMADAPNPKRTVLINGPRFHAWFHPYLAAGANVAWQRVTDHVGPTFAYDEFSRAGRLVEPQRTDAPRTDIIFRPYVATGFKAYTARRAFFRSDLRASFGRRLDEVIVRFGFGVDF